MSANPPNPLESDSPLPSRISTGLHKIALAMRHHDWARGHRLSLTPTQAQILARLLARPGCRLSDIADDLALTPATVSDAVAALDRKGLLHKSRAEDDARAVSLSLTAEGRRAARAATVWPDFLADAVESLTPDEQAALLRSLVKLIRTLQHKGQIPVQRMCVTCRHFRPHAHPGSERPHHCTFVDAPFGDRSLRLDCPDHDPAPARDAAQNWKRFSLVSLTTSGKE